MKTVDVEPRSAITTTKRAGAGLLGVALVSGGLASMLVASPASATGGCDDSWVGPTSGVQSWAVAANWTNGVPDYYTLGPNGGNHSNPCIDSAGTYTVVLPATTTYINSINIGGASGTQTLLADASTASVDLDVSATSTISAHGAITLNSTAAGSATLTKGTYTGGNGTLSVASGGLLSTSGATGSAVVDPPVTNAVGGTLSFGAPDTNVRFSSLITNYGAVTVDDSAVLDLTSGGSFTNAAGTLTVNGTFQMADGTFTASGGAESGNPVVLTGGILSDTAGTGAFDVTGNSTFYGDVPAGQTVTVDGVSNSVSLTIPGAPTVHGTLALHSTAAGSAGLASFQGNGSVSVASGGVLSTSGAAGSAITVVDVPVTNATGGTVTIGAPSSVFRFGAQVTNSGTFTVTDGGHLDMSGTTLTNTAAGTIGVTVNANTGTVSGISGAVTAAGTLAVQTIGSPALGATFVPLTGPVSATFTSFAFGPHAYTVTYPAGSVQLTSATAPAPAVTAISPASGPIAGGTTVTISGTGFTSASGVRFGAAPATNVTVVSDTQITAVSPAHAAGRPHIVVTTAAGASPRVRADRFRYTVPAPAVTAISPASGPAAGGTTVTITGTGFTGVTRVRFGSEVATSVTVVSDTQITAVSPAHAVGTVKVNVTNSGGTSPAGTASRFTFQ